MLQKIDNDLLIYRTGAKTEFTVGTILMGIALAGFGYFVNIIADATTDAKNPLVLKLQICGMFGLFFGLFFFFGCRLFVKAMKARKMIVDHRYEVKVDMITKIESVRRNDSVHEEVHFRDYKKTANGFVRNQKTVKGDTCYLFFSIDTGALITYFPVKSYFMEELERPEIPTEVEIDGEHIVVGEKEAVEQRAKERSLKYMTPCVLGGVLLGFVYGFIFHTIMGAAFFGFAMILVILLIYANLTVVWMKRGVLVKAKALEVKKYGDFKTATYEFTYENETKVITKDETDPIVTGKVYDAFYHPKQNELFLDVQNDNNSKMILLMALCIYVFGLVFQLLGF